jgi:hypothetical protein
VSNDVAFSKERLTAFHEISKKLNRKKHWNPFLSVGRKPLLSMIGNERKISRTSTELARQKIVPLCYTENRGN